VGTARTGQTRTLGLEAGEHGVAIQPAEKVTAALGKEKDAEK